VKVEIVLADRTLPVEIDARDRRAFEVIGRPALGLQRDVALDTIPKLAPESYVLWLAWHAAHREGLTTDAFPEFEATVLEVENLTADQGADIPDPTRAAR